MEKVMKIEEVLPIYNLAYMASTIDKRMIKNHVGSKHGFIYGVNSAVKVNVLCGDSEYVSLKTIRRARENAIKAYITKPVPYYKSRLVLWTMVEAVLDERMSVDKLREKAMENKRRGLGLQVISELSVQEQLRELQKRGYSLRDIERAAKNIRQAEEIMAKAAA